MSTWIAIVDYGVGNLFSLQSSLAHIGADCRITGDAAQLRQADKMILPGVGAFGDAVDALRSRGLDTVICREAGAGRPLLGICLGMQLLFNSSCEHGEHRGLGLIPGSIRSLRADLGDTALKVPHMGWNSLEYMREHPLLQSTPEHSHVYYVHSYYAPVSEDTVAGSRYGKVQISGVVARGNVWGCQFHPEKSGEVGLGLLRSFLDT